jgi:micrococcal nuclease
MVRHAGRQQRRRLLAPFWRRHPIAAVSIVALVVLACLDRSGVVPQQGDDRSRYHDQVFTVVKVVDGDTLDVDIPDGVHATTRIRLWGVDTPEVAGSRDGAMYFGAEASAFAKEKLFGKRVRLELSSTRTRDKYDRLLAYVYIVETGEMFNELLLTTGHAYADTRFDHVWMERFVDLEKRAMRGRVGLWREVTPEKMPEWKRRRYRPTTEPAGTGWSGGH